MDTDVLELKPWLYPVRTSPGWLMTNFHMKTFAFKIVHIIKKFNPAAAN